MSPDLEPEDDPPYGGPSPYAMHDADHTRQFPPPGEMPSLDPAPMLPDEERAGRDHPGRSRDRRRALDRQPVPGRTRPAGPGRSVTSRARQRGQTSKRSNKAYVQDPGPCPFQRVAGHKVRTTTGEVTAVAARCMRRRCPSCKHVLLRRKAAQYRDFLPTLAGTILFVTLTEHRRYSTIAEAVAAIRHRFRRKFLPKLRAMTDVTPWRVAQVDIKGRHVHIHALIGAPLDQGDIVGAWFRSGGGLDGDVQTVQPDPDEVARCAIYVLKGALDIRTGPEMTSHGVGFYSARSVEERRAYMAASSDPEVVFEPAERIRVERSPRRSTPTLEHRAEEATSNRAVSKLPGDRHALVSTYDPETKRVTVTAVRLRGQDGPEVELARCSTKSAGRRYLRRREAHLRQRRPAPLSTS